MAFDRLGPKSLYSATNLVFNSLDGGVRVPEGQSLNKITRMSADGQGTKLRPDIAKENFNRLSRAHERYRQTTDGRTTTYSEREREFTFAKNN